MRRGVAWLEARGKRGKRKGKGGNIGGYFGLGVKKSRMDFMVIAGARHRVWLRCKRIPLVAEVDEAACVTVPGGVLVIAGGRRVSDRSRL